VRPSNIALLEDRIATQNGRPQRYGSQFHTEPDGSVVPCPIEDPERLDERRASVGLGPFAEYRDLVERMQRKRS
jgi:hypothetical protein